MIRTPPPALAMRRRFNRRQKSCHGESEVAGWLVEMGVVASILFQADARVVPREQQVGDKVSDDQ